MKKNKGFLTHFLDSVFDWAGLVSAATALLVLGCVAGGGGPAPAPPGVETAPDPVSLDGVTMHGTCNGELGVNILVYGLVVPMKATIKTDASPVGTTGRISVSVPPFVSADCVIGPVAEGSKNCVIRGVMVPRQPPPAAPQITNEESEDDR